MKLVKTLPFGLLALFSISCAQTEPEFTDAERFEISRYWNAPGRYRSERIEDPKGPWKVRLTPDGSQWMWQYNRARGLGKTPPGTTPPPLNEQQKVWETWLDSRVAFDRYKAGVEAAKYNGLPEPGPVVDPGPAPIDLVTLAGEPPVFANAVRPTSHEIVFEDMTIKYTDNPEMRPRYAYYRNEMGVMHGGTRMKELPPSELDTLLRSAGISESESRIFKAVSLLEGGFDSVNTYDTGFISVGFIQFASLAQGGHSLGATLRQMKQDNPRAFQDDFRRFGIDVMADGTLVAVEPKTSEIVRGPLANAAVIEDKRLIATFARAGRRAPYRVAQLRTAKAMYYPADTMVTVKSGDRTLSGKIREIIRSEAGMAALMDRKVNTGNISILAERLALLLSEKPNFTKFSDFAPYEAQLLDSLWYRVDTRNDKSLSQPMPTTERSAALEGKSGARSRGSRRTR